MARLKNSETGVVVTTDDDRAEILRGLGYEPEGESKSSPKRTPAKATDDKK